MSHSEYTYPTLNSTEFGKWIRTLSDDSDNDKPFKPNIGQTIVRRFLGDSSPHRGLLLYHALGAGKTCAAIGIAQSVKDVQRFRKIVVVLAAALKSNFYKEIMMCGGYDPSRTKWKLEGEKWVQSNAGDMFDALDTNAQSQIAAAVRSNIESRYSFVHFNGLNKKSISEMQSQGNPFDNCVVIIDEVHNLTKSVVRGSSFIHKALFEMIMTARSCKIVALSGTPMVNEPAEIGFLISMIKGIELRYICPMTATISRMKDAIVDHSCVIQSGVDRQNDQFWLQLTPEGFQLDKARTHFVPRDKSFASENEALAKSIVAHSVGSVQVVPFPLDRESFDAKYVDDTNDDIINKDEFMQRVFGFVSYYAPSSEDVYPEVIKHEVHMCQLSEDQLRTYVIARTNEIQIESSSRLKRNQKDSDDQGGISVYRSFSRRVCNFVFPSSIRRMFKKDLRILYGDVDDALYKKHVTKAMRDLVASPDSPKWLSVTGELGKYSPKCVKLLETLADMPRKGTALIYSEFRDVPEGLYSIKSVLDFNGYEPFDVTVDNKDAIVITKPNLAKKRYMMFDASKRRPAMQQLLNVFNNEWHLVDDALREAIHEKFGFTSNMDGKICSVLLISASGSEGISLKNVRQVHIFEPYWQRVRTQQVVGRARRAYSHHELPKSERNVSVHMYVASFGEDQELPRSIRNSDGSMTSDQHLLSVAVKKGKTIDKFQEALQRAAIDCSALTTRTDCFSPSN